MLRHLAIACLVLALGGCGKVWNDPYPASRARANILYSAFSERPKHLDPARAYSSNETEIIGQIYEPPLQYSFLKRPYTLEPLTAQSLPRVRYYDKAGRELPADAPIGQIAESVYDITLKPGIYYQPHPAFAVDAHGGPRYLHLGAAGMAGRDSLADFHHSGTRELTAADYVYEIKRLADPAVASPIYSLMAQYILGLRRLGAQLEQARKNDPHGFIDLDRYALPGAQVTGRYSYRITLKGKYPQFLYWLAMPFFAPVPRVVDEFYRQPGMAQRNLSLDTQPVGTGAFMLTVNEPNRRMVLMRNPDFHAEFYPRHGMPGDAARGLLRDAGKRLPLLDGAVYSLEKENIPYWNKFLQGYYDASGLSSDSFDQAIRFGVAGQAELAPAMRVRGMQLITAVAPSIWYLGFNMLDPVVGGLDAKHRELRQAISIAVDYEQFIDIFLNGRGVPGQGALPPGIYGYDPNAYDPWVYQRRDGRIERRPLAYARELLARAGYPDGRNAATGQPLVLYFDTMASGPDARARLEWYRKQFAKLGIQLVVRATDYNRFQDKMRHGNDQIFEWGWNADYPDPENFFFLLYGPNGKVKDGGENAANYANPEFDRLFEQMRYMDDGPARLALIDRMNAIVERDAPWVFAYYPKAFTLVQPWVYNVKPNFMANNTLKYRRIDPALRARLREAWNRPVLWPLGALAVGLVLAVLPAWRAWRRKERQAAR